MNKLAIDSGKKTNSISLPSWPHYAEDEIEAVADVLRSGNVNQWTGGEVNEFEAACAKAFEQLHAVAVFNASVALELALIAANIGPGDEVIVTPRSFVASVSCVVMRGATPVFADVDLLSQNMTPESIKAVISPRTKAIIPVHLNGWPCDMLGIMELAQQHGLYVIEDCAQAHGAKINGRSVGSFGQAAIFSFCQDKIISTGGEGGMVLFREEDDWRRAWSFKDHGKNYDTVFKKQHPPGFRWLHESFGTNWRMSGMQAAIGLKQLEKLSGWTARRTQIAKKLTDCLTPFSAVSVPEPDDTIEQAYYRLSFHIDESKLKSGWNRGKVMAAINAEGVPCLEVCSEIYKEKAFDKIDMPEPSCPNAIRLDDRVALLVLHPRLRDEDVKNMCQSLTRVFQSATKFY